MNNVAIITGGAGGMGLACAKILGKTHQVVICDITQKKLDSASQELAELNIQSRALFCDITDQNSVAKLFEEASTLGHIACVVHTAGISPQMANPEAILKVNSLGTIHITKAALKIATEGFALVNVASMAGHMLPSILIPKRAYKYALSDTDKMLKKQLFPCHFMPKKLYRNGMAYSISKNFVIWYSQRMAGAFGEKGARIVSVSPGSFDTQMGRLEEESGSAAMLKTAAFKRFGRPEEIAELLAFCVSDKASYITGTDILCDGGVIAGRT